MSSSTDVIGLLIAIADTSSTLRPSRFATCPWMAGLATRHSAIGVMDNNKFRPHRAGSWLADGGGQNAENAEISHHCGSDPAACVTYDECVAESESEEVCRIDAGVEAGQEDR